MTNRTYIMKRNGQIETGEVVETIVYETPKSFVVQTAYGDTLVYRVMSRNDICLFESVSTVKSVEYADWFTRVLRDGMPICTGEFR